jgi:signal transduction histidine kinase/ActR/RegA family two-component response regulator
MRPDPTSSAWPLAAATAAALFTLGNLALVFDVRQLVDEREESIVVLRALYLIQLQAEQTPGRAPAEKVGQEDAHLVENLRQEVHQTLAQAPSATQAELDKLVSDFADVAVPYSGPPAEGQDDPDQPPPPEEFEQDDWSLHRSRVDGFNQQLNARIREKQDDVNAISATLARRWRVSHSLLFIASAIAGLATWLLRRTQLRVRDLRGTQAKLRETRSRLAAVVSNAPIAVWSIDDRGTLELFEGAALESFGARPGQGVGESVFEIYRAEPVVVDAHHRALLGEAVEYRVDLNGARLQCLLLPMRDALGRITGALGVGTDVTEYERAKSEMRRTELQRIENQKAEAVGRVAGGVAHEFSNLLTVVTGFASLLRANPELAGQDREDIHQILKASSRAAELTQQLLAFSRRQRSEPRVLDVNALIIDARKMLEPLLPRVQVEILPCPEMLAVRVDPGQFRQALLNLALNAKDAMPGGGRFTLSARLVRRAEVEPDAVLEPDDYVCVTVADTGEGMDEETQQKAFEPFFTTKGPQRGTGLGLPTVQGILRQAGGDITVASALGKGTTFRLYLPRVVDAEVELESDTKELALTPGRETILLVEDEEMVRSFASRVLRQAGYQVLEAPDGESALQLARNHGGGIALLVTDVVMPKLDGPQLARRFGEQRPGVPVVFLSGFSHEDAALEYLQKPFTPQELCRIVRARLDAQALTRSRPGV